MSRKNKNGLVNLKCVFEGLSVILILISGMRLLVLSKTLGNIRNTYTVPETSVAAVSFPGEAGSKIRISFASRIENGSLEITIYDSKGNAVKELDYARELKDYLTLDDTDVYTLEAECVDFVGRYKVSLYQWN